MAENISDNEFKAEVIRFIEVANQKFDGLISDVRTSTFKIDQLENGLQRVEKTVNRMDGNLRSVASDVKVLSGQFSDVGIMAIEDNQRIDSLEKRVDVLETETH